MNQQTRARWLLLFTLFQVLIGFGIIMPIMPALAKRLGGSSIEMGLTVTLWAGAQFLTSPWWGALSDRIGRRPVMLVGIAGYAIAFVAMGLAPTMPLFLATRVLGGFLSAGTIPAAHAYAADVSPPTKRGAVMASMGAAMNLGFICGPTLGALLAPFGESATFNIAAGLAVLNLVLTYFLLPEPAHHSTGAKPGTKKVNALQVLRGPESIFYILTFVATYGGSQMFSMLGFYLIDRFGFGVQQTGLALTVEGAAAAGLQILLVGPAIRKLGEIGTIRAALISGSLGFACLVLAPGMWLLLVGLVLIAGAVDLLRPTVSSLLSTRTSLEQGVTMGIQTSFDALGRTVGPMVAGLLYTFEPRLPFIAIIIVFIGVLFWTRTSLQARVEAA